MTDRELLEAAARAVGLSIYFDDVGQCCKRQPRDPLSTWLWNPLTDDGEALRLAVTLRLCFGPNFDGDKAVCFGEAGNNITEPMAPDPYAATRRAIVRAAATLGAP